MTSLGFLSSIPLDIQRAHARGSRRSARCVLDERRAEAPESAPSAKPTPKYRRLSNDDYQRRSQLAKPKFHASLPFIGETIENFLNLSNPVSLSKRYDKVYQSNFSVYGSNVLYIGDFQSILEMTRDNDNFSTKDILPSFQSMFGKDVLVHLEAPKHTVIRKSVAPAFSPVVMMHYFEGIRGYTERLLKRIEQAVAEKGKTPVFDMFERHHLDIVISITSGVEDPDFVERMRLGFKNMLSDYFSPLILLSRKRAESGRREMLDSIADVVRSTLIERADVINRLRESGGEDIAFWATKEMKKGGIDMMLIVLAQSSLKTGPDQVHDPKIVEDIANLIVFMWVAGYGTSSATVTAAMFEVGRDRAIYDALKAEQDEIVRRSGGVRKVTYEQMDYEMPLMDSFFMEMVRMYPTGAGVMRRPRTDIEVAGHYVKANTTMFFDFWAAGRDPNVYPNPDTLVIDRYLKKSGQQVPKMIGFGVAGSPHYCLGSLLAKVFVKTSLSMILREYDFTLEPKQRTEYGVFPDIFPKSGCIVQTFDKRFNDS